MWLKEVAQFDLHFPAIVFNDYILLDLLQV